MSTDLEESDGDYLAVFVYRDPEMALDGTGTRGKHFGRARPVVVLDLGNRMLMWVSKP